MLAYHSLLSESKGELQPVDITLDKELSKIVKRNRKTLVPIVDTIKFCGHMALPLRGHRDNKDEHPETGEYSENQVGLFVELLNLRVRAGDEVLKTHLDNAPENATYISAPTQNELINCFSDVITEKIVSDIKKAKFFTIIADECSDCSNLEQLSIVIRFVDDNYNIREEFLRFCELKEGLTGSVLAKTIMNCLKNDLKLT